MKAVITAGGLGTRMLYYTKSSPKEMLPVATKDGVFPVIHLVVEEAVKSGIDDILIITSRGKHSIEDYFDRNIEFENNLRNKGDYETAKSIEDIANLADIHFIRQKEPLGLGHAVLCAKKHVGDETFALLLGDDIVINDVPCTKQLINAYNALPRPTNYSSKIMVAVQMVDDKKLPLYGVVNINKFNVHENVCSYCTHEHKVDTGCGYPDPHDINSPYCLGETCNCYRLYNFNGKTYRVISLVEKPSIDKAPSKYGMTGRYILDSSIFNAINSVSGRGEIQLTDAINFIAKNTNNFVYANEFNGTRYDLGNKVDWVNTVIDLARNNSLIE